MADGGEISLSSGSEYVYDFFCELCFDDGKQIQANGYCSDCKEYLCEKCFHGHTSTRQTRHHVLLDKKAMPKDTPTSDERSNKDISTKCKTHNAKLVEFYCPGHDVLGCSTCFATVHKSCPDVESVLEKAEDILDNEELKNFRTRLKTLKIKSDEMITLARDNRCLSKKCWTDLVSSVAQIKEEAIKAINESESNILSMADKICLEDDEKMANIVKECNNTSEKLEQITIKYERLRSSKRVCQLYIELKQTEGQINTLHTVMRNVEGNNFVNSFGFKPNVELKLFLNNPNVLGMIELENKQLRETCASFLKEPVIIREDTALDARTVETRNDDVDLMAWCCTRISGMAVFSSNKLILVDHWNTKVQISNIHLNTIVSELGVESKPWDVTVFNTTQVAVTLPDRKKILILGVSDTLTKEREITVRGACHGIDCIHDKLVVTYTDTARLDILDLHGNVIRTIEHDSEGRKLFKEPAYVCVNKNGTIIYVSDKESNTVTALTFNGEVKSQYVYNGEEGLRYPDKLCTDHRGYVYVCGGSDFMECIYRLTADCTRCEVMMPDLGGRDCGAQSISHCPDTNRLFVGMYGSSAIYVYQLS